MAEHSDLDPEKRPMYSQDCDVEASSQTDMGEKISLVSDLWIIVSVITFIADVGSDVLVCIHYNTGNHVWYLRITLGFIAVASLVLQVFSAKWFVDDGRSSCKMCLLHIAQLGPLSRYWSALRLCWMSRQGRIENSYASLVPKWRDLCMLRLLQAFIQAAPQAVFQLYVLCRKGTFVFEDDLIIAIAAVTSLITIVWSLVCYSKALRDLRDNARDLPWVGFTCQVLWRTFMVVSRVVALVLFASHFQLWLLMAVLGHWLLMAMWLTCQRTQFCIDETGREHPCKERLFNSVIAFIYVFCFFNTKEGMTRKRVVLFYSVMLVENSLLISMWYPNRSLNVTWTYAVLCIVWGGFVLGVIFMIFYYKFYHHTHAFKGIFIRTKTFNYHGRKMYGMYFCCCCRLKKWDVAIYDCVNDSTNNPSPLLGNDLSAERQNTNSLHDGNLNWDNEDIQMRPVNGSCMRGDNPDQDGFDHRRFTSDDFVPNIVVTGASPIELSPQDSLCNLSHEEAENVGQDSYVEEDPPLSPGQSSLDKAREILASKLTKGNESNEDPVEDEDEIPTINYGTVSFGNRYSLVSSDCISISSESSLSSFTNSLNDLLDRMGVASNASEPVQLDEVKTSPADEGIYSDDHDSPSKSVETGSEPSPSHNVQPGLAMDHKDSPHKEEMSKILESMMDAPSSPYVSKRKRNREKDEGSESESTDASSDDRERRHSCEDLSFVHSTPNEQKSKRHSFDIADLSTSYKRAKRKCRNRKRFNKIIIFDNFVSSALKPGKFGSLRKSYERLSKIQEDTEESGLVSNDSLREEHDTPCNDLESPCNISKDISGINATINESIGDDETEEVTNVTSLEDINENLSSINHNLEREDVQQPLQMADLQENISNRLPSIEDISIRNVESEGCTSSNDLSDDNLVKADIISLKVRMSYENVPLACCEDFDDDLGSSMDDDIDLFSGDSPEMVSPTSVKQFEDSSLGIISPLSNRHDNSSPISASPTSETNSQSYLGLVSPPSDKNVSLRRNWSTDSIADSESSKGSPINTISRSIASSGSSIFENYIFAENNIDSPETHKKKRHTYDFGAHRKNKTKPAIVKRLGSSSSQYTLPRNPGSPVWVRKGPLKHRRPRKITPQKSNSDENDREFIQEVRV